MTRRSVLFVSLFALVALFLGVITTGCSEGDNTIASLSSDHKLKLTIGFQNGTKSMTKPCPKPKKILVGVQKQSDGSFDEVQFAEKESGNIIKAWTPIGDNKVELVRDVTEEYVPASKINGIVRVQMLDDNDAVVGAYVCKTLDYSNTTVTHDFSNNEDEYVPVSDFQKNVSLDNYADGNITVKEGEVVELSDTEVAVTYSVEGVPVGSKNHPGISKLEADPSNQNIEIEGNKIKGITASKNNDLTITCRDGATNRFNVIVVNPTPPTYSVKLNVPASPVPDEFNVEYTLDGEPQGPKTLTVQNNEVCKGEAGQEVVITSATCTIGGVNYEAGGFNPADAKVTINADETMNVIEVTSWTKIPAPVGKVKLVDDSPDAPKPVFGTDDVTVNITVNGKTEDKGVGADGIFYTGLVGDEVTVNSVIWMDNGSERTATFTPTAPVSATEAGAVVTVTAKSV